MAELLTDAGLAALLRKHEEKQEAECKVQPALPCPSSRLYWLLLLRLKTHKTLIFSPFIALHAIDTLIDEAQAYPETDIDVLVVPYADFEDDYMYDKTEDVVKDVDGFTAQNALAAAYAAARQCLICVPVVPHVRNRGLRVLRRYVQPMICAINGWHGSEELCSNKPERIQSWRAAYFRRLRRCWKFLQNMDADSVLLNTNHDQRVFCLIESVLAVQRKRGASASAEGETGPTRSKARLE